MLFRSSREVSALRTEASDMLLMGTLAQYRAVLATLREQPFGLSKLADDLAKFLEKRGGGSRILGTNRE